MQPTPNNDPYFRLPFKEFLERFFFNRWTMAEQFPLSLDDKFAKTIIEQIRYNDPKSEYVTLEITNNPRVFNLWKTSAWKAECRRLEETRQKDIANRRSYNSRLETITRLADHITSLIPVLDKQTTRSMAETFLDTPDVSIIAPLLAQFKLTAEDLKIHIPTVNENESIVEQKLIDLQLEQQLQIKITYLKDEIKRQLASGATVETVKDWLSVNGYKQYLSNGEIVNTLKGK